MSNICKTEGKHWPIARTALAAGESKASKDPNSGEVCYRCNKDLPKQKKRRRMAVRKGW